MNTKDFVNLLRSTPITKVLGAYHHLSGNPSGVTKQEAIEWLSNAFASGTIDHAMFANAPSLAGSVATRMTKTNDTADIDRAVNAATDAVRKVDSKIDAQITAVMSTISQNNNNLNDRMTRVVDDVNATTNALAGLTQQVNVMTRKMGQFVLDEAQINTAVTQVIDNAFAPFRKAVEDAGLQEVVADLTSVRVIDRRPALDVFGVEVTDMKGNPLMVDIWNHPAAPDVDPLFIWTRPILEDLLGVQETGENLWFGGDRGTGKSETARQFAARTGRNFARVNYHKHSSADEFIGAVGLENGQTTFKCGSFLQAFLTPSTVILNDEISNAPEGELATLNPLLEPNCAVIYGGAVRRRAPGVMIFAADNTLGNGDESGRYAGTRTMNSALIDRFARIIHFQYLPMDEEAKAVVNHTGCTDELARHVLTCIHAARGKVSDGEIIDAPSIRSVVAFIRALKTKKVEDAWMSCIVSRQPSESKSSLLALAEVYLDKALINNNL